MGGGVSLIKTKRILVSDENLLSATERAVRHDERGKFLVRPEMKAIVSTKGAWSSWAEDAEDNWRWKAQPEANRSALGLELGLERDGGAVISTTITREMAQCFMLRWHKCFMLGAICTCALTCVVVGNGSTCLCAR